MKVSRALIVMILLGQIVAAAAEGIADPRQVFDERRFAPLHHDELIPQLVALEDVRLTWFLTTGCRLAAMRWDEQVVRELAIPWKPLRIASVQNTFAARLDLLELLIATLEATDDERFDRLPGKDFAGLSRLLCRLLGSGDRLLPHAYGSDLKPGGRVIDLVERRDRLRQRWRVQLARWPEWQLDAWIHRVLEDPTAQGLLASLPDRLAIDTAFDQEAILGYPDSGSSPHLSLHDLPDVLLRLAAPDFKRESNRLPAPCRLWLQRARDCSAWRETDWDTALDGVQESTVDAAELARWAALLGRSDPETVAAAIERLGAMAIAAGVTDPAWTDRLAPVIIARRGPAGLRAWLNELFDDLVERHGDDRALAWAFACVGRPRLLPGALGRLGRLTGLPDPQRRQVNRRLANLFNGSAYRHHRDAAWFFIAASPLADPGPEFDPCLFEGQRHNRLDNAFVPFRIARVLPQWHRKDGENGFLAKHLTGLPDGIGKAVLQGLSQPEQSGCGEILNMLAAQRERLPLNYRDRIFYELRHVIGRRVDYGIRRPADLDTGGAALFNSWYKQVDDEKHRWAAAFFATDGPFDPKELASWTASIAVADPGLALRLLKHAANRAHHGDRRPNLPLLTRTIKRLWADPAPAVDAVVLRLMADPEVELLLLPDDDWGGAKVWRKRAKNYKGGLPALLRDLHDGWNRLLPSDGREPLLPCLVALLDLLADDREAYVAWLDELRDEPAADTDPTDLTRLWLLAADQRRLRDLLLDGADTSEITPLVTALAAWYREALATAKSSCLRLFIASQAADREQTWQMVHHLWQPCMDERFLPHILTDLLAHLRHGQAWPIPDGDALWDRLLAAASDPAFEGPVEEWLDSGYLLRTAHPASAARSYRIRDAWVRPADDDQHRLLAGLFRLALSRRDQARVGVLLATDDEILLRSSGTYADLVRHAEARTVVRLFDEHWRRIDREPFASHYDARLDGALAPVLEGIEDADLRLLLRCMLEALPSHPRPDQRRARLRRQAQAVSADPQRIARVEELAATVHDHTFADVAKQDRCVWFLMGLGRADTILAEEIGDCAQRIGYAGLEDLQEQDPWAFRMGYWCLRDCLLRAGRTADVDTLLELIASAEGAERTELGYHQRDLQSLLLDPDVQAPWRVEDWRRLGVAGRRAIDWTVGDRIWSAKRIWKWVVPVSLLAGDLDELADWLTALPDALRREVTSTSSTIRVIESLQQHTRAIIRPELQQRVHAWLDHPELAQLLPADPEQLGSLVAADLLDMDGLLARLQAMAGSQRGHAWAALAVRHREAGRLSQALVAYQAAAEMGRKRDRRDWLRAAEQVKRQLEQEAKKESEPNKRADVQDADGKTEAETVGPSAASADGF